MKVQKRASQNRPCLKSSVAFGTIFTNDVKLLYEVCQVLPRYRRLFLRYREYSGGDVNPRLTGVSAKRHWPGGGV